MVIYKQQSFETKLAAQWAAFFDLAGWSWIRGIAPIGNWKPDFLVTFACGHSECRGNHTILVSVLSVHDISTVKGHPALSHPYSVTGDDGTAIADGGALFGDHPAATIWQMSHGAGGGTESVPEWVDRSTHLWQQAERLVS